jgi:hypothetical protein
MVASALRTTWAPLKHSFAKIIRVQEFLRPAVSHCLFDLLFGSWLGASLCGSCHTAPANSISRDPPRTSPSQNPAATPRIRGSRKRLNRLRTWRGLAAPAHGLILLPRAVLTVKRLRRAVPSPLPYAVDLQPCGSTRSQESARPGCDESVSVGQTEGWTRSQADGTSPNRVVCETEPGG